MIGLCGLAVGFVEIPWGPSGRFASVGRAAPKTASRARPVLAPRAGCSAGCCELLSRAARAGGTHPGDIFGAAAWPVLSYSKEERSLPVAAQQGSSGQDPTGKAKVHRSVSTWGLALLALQLASVHGLCCRLPSCSVCSLALLGMGVLCHTHPFCREQCAAGPSATTQCPQNMQCASRCTLRVHSSPPRCVPPPPIFPARVLICEISTLILPRNEHHLLLSLINSLNLGVAEERLNVLLERLRVSPRYYEPAVPCQAKQHSGCFLGDL